ncbi:MAG: hypothetical protein A2104_04785 [Candidatus Melainabacteria bacterium GWF2_32_7]|nr:MAG: hypothetical protein A2104_04785 [Candidatus Melainabacteria bacterium GWF2_32_7]OGI18019.1 MAG: hypothetical protein A2255_00535 [Candidatus Melainabacteria bacterium RIFOXYA2_FULL_32_9]
MSKFKSLIILTFILFIGLLLSILPIKVPGGIDKIFHFIVFYGTTTFSTYIIIKAFGNKWINHYLIAILMIGGGLATLSELIQDYVPLRSCDLDDWFINLTGIGASILVTYLLNQRSIRESEILEEEFLSK